MDGDNNHNLETTNINLKWLNNIYEQLTNIQNMERLCREGCTSIADYIMIPMDKKGIVLPDAQYKTLKFLIMEMDLLIDNLSPILGEKTDSYKKRIAKVLNIVNDPSLFVKPIYSSEKQLSYIQVLPLYNETIIYISQINSDLIRDIGHLLYIKEEQENKKKW
jgi:hypothetical protein